MKNLFRPLFGATLLSLSVGTGFAADQPLPGYVDFGKFTPAAGGEFVEVNVNNNLICMAAKFVEKQQPDVAKMLRGIQRVRVNVIGLNDQNRADLEQRVKTIRENLDQQGWQRVVTAVQAKEDVGVYLKTRGEEAVEGLVVTVIDGGQEAVFINVVGDIRPDKLAELGEKLNIEPLKKLGGELKK